MKTFHLTAGEGPLLAAAIHAGHAVHPDVLPLMALGEAERLREEDPFTDRLCDVAASRLVAARSRFEFDLNRPRRQAIYTRPEDCWGLTVWRTPRPRSTTVESLENYDLFYAVAATVIRQLTARHGKVIVLDLHSYNHRRDGAEQPPADPQANPDVNIGTGTMDRQRWAPAVDRFIDDLRRFDYLGRSLDVRENVRFRGGRFVGWIHETFPDSACGIAVEFKKFFMDEWTGEVDERQLAELQRALASTIPGLLSALRELGGDSSAERTTR